MAFIEQFVSGGDFHFYLILSINIYVLYLIVALIMRKQERYFRKKWNVVFHILNIFFTGFAYFGVFLLFILEIIGDTGSSEPLEWIYIVVIISLLISQIIVMVLPFVLFLNIFHLSLRRIKNISISKLLIVLYLIASGTYFYYFVFSGVAYVWREQESIEVSKKAAEHYMQENYPFITDELIFIHANRQSVSYNIGNTANFVEVYLNENGEVKDIKLYKNDPKILYEPKNTPVDYNQSFQIATDYLKKTYPNVTFVHSSLEEETIVNNEDSFMFTFRAEGNEVSRAIHVSNKTGGIIQDAFEELGLIE